MLCIDIWCTHSTVPACLFNLLIHLSLSHFFLCSKESYNIQTQTFVAKTEYWLLIMPVQQVWVRMISETLGHIIIISLALDFIHHSEFPKCITLSPQPYCWSCHSLVLNCIVFPLIQHTCTANLLQVLVQGMPFCTITASGIWPFNEQVLWE